MLGDKVMLQSLIYVLSATVIIMGGHNLSYAADHEIMRGFVRVKTPQSIRVQSEEQLLDLQLSKRLQKQSQTIKEGDYVKIEYTLTAEKIEIQKPDPHSNQPKQQPGTLPMEQDPKRILDDRAFYPA